MSQPFINIEKPLIAFLRAQPALTGRKIGTDKPTPLDKTTLPFVQITASGGSSRQVDSTLRADVEVLSTDRGSMWDLTAIVHDAVKAARGNLVGGLLVDTLVAIQLPAFVAWSPAVPRTVAVYEFVMRPAPPA